MFVRMASRMLQLGLASNKTGVSYGSPFPRSEGTSALRIRSWVFVLVGSALLLPCLGAGHEVFCWDRGSPLKHEYTPTHCSHMCGLLLRLTAYTSRWLGLSAEVQSLAVGTTSEKTMYNNHVRHSARSLWSFSFAVQAAASVHHCSLFCPGSAQRLFWIGVLLAVP